MYFTPAGALQKVHIAQQGGLTSPGKPNNALDTAGRYVQADVVNRGDRFFAFGSKGGGYMTQRKHEITPLILALAPSVRHGVAATSMSQIYQSLAMVKC